LFARLVVVSDDGVFVCQFVAVFAMSSGSRAALHVGELRHQLNVGRVTA
jgi:hypothetical protein